MHTIGCLPYTQTHLYTSWLWEAEKWGYVAHWLQSLNCSLKTLGSIPWWGRMEDIFLPLRVNYCTDWFSQGVGIRRWMLYHQATSPPVLAPTDYASSLQWLYLYRFKKNKWQIDRPLTGYPEVICFLQTPSPVEPQPALPPAPHKVLPANTTPHTAHSPSKQHIK